MTINATDKQETLHTTNSSPYASLCMVVLGFNHTLLETTD